MDKPETYGQWWEGEHCTPAWYSTIHSQRADVHASFLQTLSELEHPITTVLEVGGGMAGIYPQHFIDRGISYTGLDISQRTVDWCRANLPGRFMRADMSELYGFDVDLANEALYPDPIFFDLVFSHAVVDHVPDIDLFLRSLLRAAKHTVYLTAYSGWYPDLAEHEQTWSESQHCFYNLLSVDRVMQVMATDGFSVTCCELPREGDPQSELMILAERG